MANSEMPRTIVTGNWGCGVFGGHVHLKAVIQILACVAAHKNILYCCYGERALFSQLNDLEQFFRSGGKDLTVSIMYSKLIKFASQCVKISTSFTVESFMKFLKKK
ncbi:hypothetical protein Ciccas_010847 [Cichlidogyrus casuarinus]|uniref:PARG catalytic Macro domain-containing protein n=1 Tax=Cichlidogyrus casuarinus TaxID=1844966 RepID=A0ABD2PTJ1_9PLAT